jgi:hypothetical protein
MLWFLALRARRRRVRRAKGYVEDLAA